MSMGDCSDRCRCEKIQPSVGGTIPQAEDPFYWVRGWMGLGTCTPARVYSPPALDYTKLLPRLPYKWTVSVS